MKSKWMPKNAKPNVSGWYYVKAVEFDYPSMRYYDNSNSSWWYPHRLGFEPNDSFSEWLNVDFRNSTSL